MPQNIFDDTSTLVQVTAWWCQASSHYLSQCCPELCVPSHCLNQSWDIINWIIGGQFPNLNESTKLFFQEVVFESWVWTQRCPPHLLLQKMSVLPMLVYNWQHFTGVILNKANRRDLIAATGLVIVLKLDSNRRYFGLHDLQIWWITSKYNRAPLLC